MSSDFIHFCNHFLRVCLDSVSQGLRPLILSASQVIITSNGFSDYLQPLSNLHIGAFHSPLPRLDHIFCIGLHSLGRSINQFVTKDITKDTDGQPDGEVHKVRRGKVPSIILLFEGSEDKSLSQHVVVVTNLVAHFKYLWIPWGLDRND